MSWRGSENLRRIGGTVNLTFTEASSFPVNLEKKGVALFISNNDAGGVLILRVYTGNKTTDFRIKNTLNIPLSPFWKFDVIQATASFDIIVACPEGEA